MTCLFLWLLGELEEGNDFETDASSDYQCGTLVESEDTFFEEHSLGESPIVEVSEVTLPVELSDPIFVESSSNLAPIPRILSLSSPLSIFLPSLNLRESIFVEFKTSVLGSPCLDQTLDDSDVDRLEDNFEAKDWSLGCPMSFDFYISFEWTCFVPLPSPFRDVGLYFHHSDHSRWFIHSYNNIIARPLICTSNFSYTHLSSNWAVSFDKLKKALSRIPFIHCTLFLGFTSRF